MLTGCVRTASFLLLLAAPALVPPPAFAAGSTVALLKPPLLPDPRKAAIQAIVRSTYPELFGATSAPGWVAVTLLLNADGSLDRGDKGETRERPYLPDTGRVFAALGADPQRYGDRLQLDMRGGAAGATRIYVRAWLPGAARDEEGPVAPNDDPAVNRAIAEKYFPDLHSYATPRYQSVADFWVLLAHEGNVLATGRRYMGSQGDLEAYLESLYPGIRMEGFQPTELRGAQGRPAVVNFTWLAADSPVTDLARADAARRGDLAIYAQVTGEGSTAETTLAAPRFGSPAVVVCDEKDLDLEITATRDGADGVILRVRMQRVARASPADFGFGTPRPLERAWSAASRPLRVRFGQTATVALADQDHGSWKVALHPDRMQGSIAAE